MQGRQISDGPIDHAKIDKLLLTTEMTTDAIKRRLHISQTLVLKRMRALGLRIVLNDAAFGTTIREKI